MRLLLVTIHAYRSPQAVPLAAACLKAYLDGRPADACPVTVSCADFFSNDYDGGAAFLILAHLSEQNNHPELARSAAEAALGDRQSLFQTGQVMLASQTDVLQTVTL